VTPAQVQSVSTSSHWPREQVTPMRRSISIWKARCTGDAPSREPIRIAQRSKRWKDDAQDHLRTRGKCDPLRRMLATSYGSGKFNTQDPSQALAFDLLAAARETASGTGALQAQFGEGMTAGGFETAYAEGFGLRGRLVLGTGSDG